MLDDIRYLRTWYPLMPQDTEASGSAAAIQDIRLYIQIPTEGLREALHINVDRVWCSLDSISAADAEAAVTVHIYGVRDEVRTVPVYTDQTSEMPADSDYVLMSELSDVSGPYRIHPDCFVLEQAAPVLRIVSRSDISSDDTAAHTAIHAVTGSLIVNDGNNVKVSGDGRGIRFTGGSGFGTGVYAEPPYTDVERYDTEPGKGLRSINGNSGDVQVSGGSNIAVEVQPDAGDSPTTLTLNIKVSV